MDHSVIEGIGYSTVLQLLVSFLLSSFSFVNILRKTPILFGAGLARSRRHGLVYFPALCLTLQSLLTFALLWYYKVKFALMGKEDSEKLNEMFTFDEIGQSAYLFAVSSSASWVWASSLLQLSIVGATLLTIEGRRIKAGQLLSYAICATTSGISVAIALFFAHILIKEYLIELKAIESKDTKADTQKMEASQKSCAEEVPKRLIFLALIACSGTIGLPFAYRASSRELFGVCLLILYCYSMSPMFVWKGNAKEGEAERLRVEVSSQAEKLVKVICLVSGMYHLIFLGSFYTTYLSFGDTFSFDISSGTSALVDEASSSPYNCLIACDLLSGLLATMVLITSETDELSARYFSC